MPLKFTTPVSLPGRTITQLDCKLVEIRYPHTITFWYERTTDQGVEQLQHTVTLDSMEIKLPVEYHRMSTALAHLWVRAAVDGGLAPAGGTVVN